MDGMTWAQGALLVALLGNIVGMIVQGSRGLKALFEIRDSLRDELRDIRRIVGHDDGAHDPSGLVLDVRNITREVRSHRDTLIEVTTNMGLRHPGGRT